MPFIFDFNYQHGQAPMELKGLLGGKGANLAEMTSVLHLPVPPGFTLSTDACRAYTNTGWPKQLDAEVQRARRRLEKDMGRVLGDPQDPLLVSVRSGAQFSMPGMMDTVLNLGLNDQSVAGLASQTQDKRFAYDSYRRFISMYGRIVLGIASEPFEEALEALKLRLAITSDSEIPANELVTLCKDFKKIIKTHSKLAFPQDPAVQLRGAIEAVFQSWNGARAVAYREVEGIDHDLGTAVNVQAMVFGNRDNNSGTGVAFTRNPAAGLNKPYGDFLTNAQGEDVVAGIRTTEPLAALRQRFPDVYKDLLAIFDRLEHHYRDMCDTEFTIEQGRLWMLQTRVGKRTGNAAFRMAVDMTRDSNIALSREEAVERITEEHISQVLHPQFGGPMPAELGRGLGASPGAAVGRVYFTADDAVEAASRGERVILVRTETSPDDVHGMLASEGVLTALGGLVSHAAVVARGWGKAAVVGMDAIKITGHHFSKGDVTVGEGDWISIDGTTGSVYLGALDTVSSESPPSFTVLLKWADKIRRGQLEVRANADNGPDADNARRLGAEGIGLCRTEHMFLKEDRLSIMRQVILADSADEERRALEALGAVQELDFYEIFSVMNALPVTVRLLDPPMHEFLPSTQELSIKDATKGLTRSERRLFEAARAWGEVNPMLGTRGIRLGVMKPGLYTMQVRSVIRAARRLAAEGGKPIVEIMVPLTVTKGELILARQWVDEAIASLPGGLGRSMKLSVGTMIETPRAALLADQIAQHADFFSFGTNDLTQMTFGFSRDDIEGRIMNTYLDKGLLKHNPFEIFDHEGVGSLVRMAVTLGRSVNPNLKVGVCGEHGGNPESIESFLEAGVDYVSCSPFRVPVARIAAAQSVMRRRR